MAHSTPEARVDLFVDHCRALCAEAGLPEFDEAHYDETTAVLAFLWHDPPFCLAAQLRTASIYGLTAASLRGAWDAKFGRPERAA